MDPPSNTWFLRTTLEYIRNLYACDSAVLRSSTVCPTHNRDHATRVVGNNRPHQALRGVCDNGAAEHRGAMNCGTASNYTSDITGQSRTRSDNHISQSEALLAGPITVGGPVGARPLSQFHRLSALGLLAPG